MRMSFFLIYIFCTVVKLRTHNFVVYDNKGQFYSILNNVRENNVKQHPAPLKHRVHQPV